MLLIAMDCVIVSAKGIRLGCCARFNTRVSMRVACVTIGRGKETGPAQDKE